MCTAILSIEPDAPVLLAGVRDELVDRAWQPPGWHWPDHPGLIGGRDLQAGGTWLAVAPAANRVTCVLNARGRMAPEGSRCSRGVLPLEVADHGKLERADLTNFDPFHLLSAEPGRAALWSWDGEHLTEQELTAGLHIVVNSGDAERPVPHPGDPVTRAWGAWLPLLNGDGIGPEDPRALVVRRDLGGGRIWGTTSISLVALSPGALRYDFTGMPGDPHAWQPVPIS
jgi:Transport and Golgi organisation 2